MRPSTLLRLGLFASFGIALASCGGDLDSQILITLGSAPDKTTQVVVNATLDGKPTMDPQTFPPTLSTFAVTLPSTTMGQLYMVAQATDSDNCLRGSSAAGLDVPSGLVDVDMTLKAVSPRKCATLPPCGAAGAACAISPLPQTNAIESMWALSANDIWAVGDAATILHYDGTTWKAVASPIAITNNLISVWASGPADVWAVGDTGKIIHYNGSQWVTSPNAALHTLRWIFGLSATDIWTVGDNAGTGTPGDIYHFTGTTPWTKITTGINGSLAAVWASSASNVLVAGENGLMMQFDGTTWRTQATGTTQFLRDVWGYSGNQVFAVGDKGTLLRYDTGKGWTALGGGSSANVYVVEGDSTGVIFAVGQSGTLLRSDPPYDKFVAQNTNTSVTFFGFTLLTNGFAWLGGPSGYLGYLDTRP